MRKLEVFVILTILLVSGVSFGESKRNVRTEYRDTQDVDFDGVDIDGTVRRPDGSYLLQRRGVDFLPIYQVRESFDDSIRESYQYMR